MKNSLILKSDGLTANDLRSRLHKSPAKYLNVDFYQRGYLVVNRAATPLATHLQHVTAQHSLAKWLQLKGSVVITKQLPKTARLEFQHHPTLAKTTAKPPHNNDAATWAYLLKHDTSFLSTGLTLPTKVATARLINKLIYYHNQCAKFSNAIINNSHASTKTRRTLQYRQSIGKLWLQLQQNAKAMWPLVRRLLNHGFRKSQLIRLFKYAFMWRPENSSQNKLARLMGYVYPMPGPIDVSFETSKLITAFLIKFRGSSSTPFFYNFNLDSESAGTYTTSPLINYSLLDMVLPGLPGSVMANIYSEIKRKLVSSGQRAHLYPKENDPNLLAASNGYLDLKKRKFRPYSSHVIFETKPAAAYHPKFWAKHYADNHPFSSFAKDGYAKSFCNWNPRTLLPNLANHKKKRVKTLLEIIEAATMVNYSHKRQIVLYGGPACGKSTFLHLLTAFFGPDKTSGVSIESLGKSFVLGSLVNKGLVASNENVGKIKPHTSNVIKSLISNEMQTVNQKYLPVSQFTFHLLLVFASNNKPKVDNHPGLARRTILINFENKSIAHNSNHNVQYFVEQRPFVDWLLYGVFQQSLAHGPFINYQLCKDDRNSNLKLRARANPVKAFVVDFMAAMKKTPVKIMPKSYVFKFYKNWAHSFFIPKLPASAKLSKVKFNKLFASDLNEMYLPRPYYSAKLTMKISDTLALVDAAKENKKLPGQLKIKDISRNWEFDIMKCTNKQERCFVRNNGYWSSDKSRKHGAKVKAKPSANASSVSDINVSTAIDSAATSSSSASSASSTSKAKPRRRRRRRRRYRNPFAKHRKHRKNMFLKGRP